MYPAQNTMNFPMTMDYGLRCVWKRTRRWDIHGRLSWHQCGFCRSLHVVHCNSSFYFDIVSRYFLLVCSYLQGTVFLILLFLHSSGTECWGLCTALASSQYNAYKDWEKWVILYNEGSIVRGNRIA